MENCNIFRAVAVILRVDFCLAQATQSFSKAATGKNQPIEIYSRDHAKHNNQDPLCQNSSLCEITQHLTRNNDVFFPTLLAANVLVSYLR